MHKFSLSSEKVRFEIFVRNQKLYTQNNKEKKGILQMPEAHSQPSQTFKVELFTKSYILFVRLRVFIC